MLHEVKFLSYNERDHVYGWIYVPACQPKGVVQLVHGFGEHSRRYLHMIVKLMDAGFIVAADDHVGHGKTALENDTWGDWGTKGCQTMMEDEHLLKGVVQEKYPEIPYFMFGHSMGSLVLRDYIVDHGTDIDGAILSGTVGGKYPLKQGIALTEFTARFKGGRSRRESLKDAIMIETKLEIFHAAICALRGK